MGGCLLQACGNRYLMPQQAPAPPYGTGGVEPLLADYFE
jgi:hypothetical protein